MTRLDSALFYILASAALTACDPPSAPTVHLRELGEVPPNDPIPQALEVCILQSELCAAHAWQPGCGLLDDVALGDCIESFEDCSYNFPEAHDGQHCRVAHAWCTLEMPFSIVKGINEKEIAICAEVDTVCPSYP